MLLKRLFLLSILVFIAISTQNSTMVMAQQDLAVISSPASNEVLQGSVEVTGSADYPSFQFYILEFSPEPITGDQWQIIGQIREAPVIDGVLAVWDTTQVPDGSYTIRLRVVRLDGNYSEAFSSQVAISNAQPLPTDTPLPDATTAPAPNLPPTVTPTPLPPTPTIVIDQPVIDTPTPRPVPTTPPLADPDEDSGSLIPTVTGFSVTPLWDACLYGSGLMVSLFLLFGFLSALRHLIISFINRRRGI